MLRRPFGLPVGRVEVGAIPPALRRANQLMASGQYVEAAGIFEQFANGALSRNGPRAPWFLLQAGHARILAGQVPAGMEHIQRGLALFTMRGQLQRMNHAGLRFVIELKAQGLTAEVNQIENYLKTNLPAGFVSGIGTSAGKPRPVLPTTCPGCGGPIRSDEVEWNDELTAECPYCGSVIRVQR